MAGSDSVVVPSRFGRWLTNSMRALLARCRWCGARQRARHITVVDANALTLADGGEASTRLMETPRA